MIRREFIKSTAFLTGTALAFQLERSLFAIPHDSAYKDTIGLQLWTVRNQMEEDKQKTLTAVASAGYQQVELMDSSHAKELLPICEDLGLNVTSSFVNWEVFANPTGENLPTIEQILEEAEAAKLKHLVFGYIGKGYRETVDHYKKHAESANKIGEKAKAAGMKLCYHNHSFEFKPIGGGRCGFEVLMEDLDHALVPFELDVFWAAIGGWEPLETMRKLKGRVSQIHLKDLLKDTPLNFDEGTVPQEAFQELGKGVIDMAEVLKVAAEIGVEQCHVEQDQSPNPIESIKQSIAHFKTL